MLWVALRVAKFLDRVIQEFSWISENAVRNFQLVLQSKAKVKRTPSGPSGGKLGVATSALESTAKLHRTTFLRSRSSKKALSSSSRTIVWMGGIYS